MEGIILDPCMIPAVAYKGNFSDYVIQFMNGRSISKISKKTRIREEELEKLLSDFLKVIKKINTSLLILGPTTDPLVSAFTRLKNKFEALYAKLSVLSNDYEDSDNSDNDDL